MGLSLATPGHVTVNAYDIAGRLVTTLSDGQATAGPHRVTWDSAAAGNVASGVYVYRIESLGESVSGKVVVVR